jgi:hypothetical protein
MFRQHGSLYTQPRPHSYIDHLAVTCAVLFVLLAVALSQTANESLKREVEQLDSIRIGQFELSGYPRGSIHAKTFSRINDYLYTFADFDAPSGRVTVYETPDENDRNVILTGTFTFASIHNMRVSFFGSSPSSTWRIERGNLKVTLGRITSHLRPFMGGTIDLGGHKIWVENDTDIESKTSSGGRQLEGSITFQTSDLVLKDAKLQVAANTRLPLTDLKSTTDIFLGLELKNGDLSMFEGSFAIGPVELRPNSPVDIAYDGFAARIVALGFQKLLLTATRKKLRTELSVFTLTAPDVTHFVNPKFNGTLSLPLAIATFIADTPLSHDAIDLQKPTAKGVHVSLASATFSSPDGFTLRNGTADISIGSADETAITGGSAHLQHTSVTLVGSSTGSVSIDDFTMTFEGQIDKLNGTVIMQIGGFAIDVNTGMDITQAFNKCSEKVPLHFAGQTGSVLANGLLTNGALTLEFGIRDFAGNLQAGEYKCEYDEPIHIPEQRAYFKYWCPTWSEPLRTCDGWTIIVPQIDMAVKMRLYIRNALIPSLVLTQIVGKADKDGIHLCHGRVRNLSPNRFDVSVGPTLNDSDFPPFRIIKETINAFSETMTTVVVSSITNFIALLSQTGVGEAFDLFTC